MNGSSVSIEGPDILGLALNYVPEEVDDFIKENIAKLYQNSSGKKSNQLQSCEFSSIDPSLSPKFSSLIDDCGLKIGIAPHHNFQQHC